MMKLRAWNKRLKQLERVVSINFDTGMVELEQKTTKFVYKENIKNLVLMQLIAQDKDDKDLYIGDMVKLQGKTSEICLKGGIIYLKGFPGLLVRWSNVELIPSE